MVSGAIRRGSAGTASNRLQVERLASLQPLRVLLLVTGTLFDESRKRWEEADNIQSLLTQLTPGH